MTRQLVCEGACNPLRFIADGALAQFRHSTGGRVAYEGSGVPRPPSTLLADLRDLKHTEHRLIGHSADGSQWQCVRCQAVRA